MEKKRAKTTNKNPRAGSLLCLRRGQGWRSPPRNDATDSGTRSKSPRSFSSGWSSKRFAAVPARCLMHARPGPGAAPHLPKTSPSGAGGGRGRLAPRRFCDKSPAHGSVAALVCVCVLGGGWVQVLFESESEYQRIQVCQQKVRGEAPTDSARGGASIFAYECLAPAPCTLHPKYIQPKPKTVIPNPKPYRASLRVNA